MTDEENSLVVAFATLDGATLPKEHFGEARQYEIYRVSATDATRLESVVNPRAGGAPGPQTPGHGHSPADDAARGKGIGRLLAQHDVQVMVSRAFGQNITRMRERFVPVVVGTDDLTASIRLVQRHWDEVRSRWLEGPARKHLVLRGEP